MIAIPCALPTGRVALAAAYERPAHAWATVVIAHGAGAGPDHPFLVGLAGALGAQGVASLRFEFAYRQAGRRMPGSAADAVAAWRAAMAAARHRARGGTVWAAGKSYGGRMASVAAAQGLIDPAGLVYFGYPLHPPGRPDRLRTDHLPQIAQPQLFLSGRRDPFADPHEQLEAAVAACQDATLEWRDGGHSFEVAGRTQPADEIGAGVAAPVIEWILTQRRSGAATSTPAGSPLP